MKNKYLKIFIMLVVILVGLGITNVVHANTISQIDMDIYVNQNGDATVTETWKCKTNKGTEVYHPYYNLGKSKIRNLTVSEGNTKYSTLDSWSTSGNLSSKAYKCGINKISNGVELCWGISTYGTHVYTAKYTISNFVSELQDSQMIYWTLIPYEFSNSIGKAKIKIYTDKAIPNNIDVWGYGNYGGLCYVSDGAIHMESNGRLSTSEYMTILAKFPEGTFNCSNKINYNFNHYYTMAEEGTTKYKENTKTKKTSIGKMIVNILNIIKEFLPMIVLIIVVGSSMEVKKGQFKKKLSKKKGYYREIPLNGNIFRAYYIGYTYGIIKNKTDLLGTLILKWIKEEKVEIKKIEKNTLLGTKEEFAIKLNIVESEIQNSLERNLYKMIYIASKDGVLEKNELKKWCKDNYSKILKWFDKVINEQEEILKKEGMITETKKTFKTKLEPAEELTMQAENIKNLKNFLLEYTMIQEKLAIEVVLLEDYLIYAQLLGIAKEVTKEFEDLYPEVIEQTHYMSYSDVMWINYCSNKGISAARSAESAARNYSSGGGGFSSGGGGGGSFGGGGGRRRLPLKL